MNKVDRYEYGESLCSIKESRKLIVEGCDPNTIRDELRAANFVRDGAKFVKNRPRLRITQNSDIRSDTLQVLGVQVVEDSLHVEAYDVVGIVRLVPGMSVQVEPKVGWDQAIEMLLTVNEIDRTQSYYGVPIDELLSSGVEAARIIAILAINYIRGIRTVRREGFIRDFHIRRRNGFEGLGSVDVEQTLMNHASGEPAPAWIETHVDYANPVNATIHMAGKLLLRLLQQDHEGVIHPRRDFLLSMVHEEVKRMEHLDIQSSQKELGMYRRLSLYDLPRQRHYYRRAMYTSQSILSSALLGQTGGGPEELLVDYALSMNSLFEDFSNRVITDAVNSLSEIDYLDQLTGVNCKHHDRLYPFLNSGAHHEPDHLLKDGGETLAVLDSKYYQEGENPAMKSELRSQLFAYAYLTGTDEMAFLCPHSPSDRLPVKQTGGEVQIVSPGEEFTTEKYRQLIRKYILEILATKYPELQIFDAVAERYLCLSGVSEDDLSQVQETDGPFSISNPATFADRVISAIAFSTYAPSKAELDDQGQWTKNRIKEACNKTDDEGHPEYPKHETTCVPIYDPDTDDEHGAVTLYFLHLTEESLVSKEGPIPLM